MQKAFQIFFILFIGFFSFDVWSQETLQQTAADSIYREDQFYFGITYNILLNTPPAMTSRGLSGGIQGGFLRDMPINKRRNVAIAVGLGLAYDQYGQNLFVGEDANGKTIFRMLDGRVDYTQNRFGMAMVEVPLELRWRTSTPSEYRFWRIYAGARIGYAYWYKTTFKQPSNNVNQTKIPEFNPIRLSATLSFGYNTFNFFASYAITPFFENAQTIEGEKIELRSLKVGLMFYIL